MLENYFGKSTVSKTIIGIFIAIFLGAIGSGLWDLFLSRLFNWILTMSLTLTSKVFHSYVDFLYKSIGKGQYALFNALPFVALVIGIIVFCIALPFIVIIRLKRFEQSILNKEKVESDTKDSASAQQKIKKRKKRIYWLILPMSLTMSLLYTSALFEEIYSWQVTSFIERSIDILAPKVPTQKVLELKAMYRSIDNSNKYFALEDSIRQLAKQHSVELPEFNSIK